MEPATTVLQLLLVKQRNNFTVISLFGGRYYLLAPRAEESISQNNIDRENYRQRVRVTIAMGVRVTGKMTEDR